MPQAKSERVQVHDFPDPKVGKAIPYGTYDVAANTGWPCPSARTTSPPPSPSPATTLVGLGRPDRLPGSGSAAGLRN